MPAIFMLLDAFPLTVNGKVDRRALPTPDGRQPELDEVFVACRTPTEELLAAIWSQVLGVERVGIYDNFFQLGGHSLLATQVVSRIREAFQVEMPLRRLFEAPTVAGLAEDLDLGGGSRTAGTAHCACSSGRRTASLLCSTATMVHRSARAGRLCL